MWSDEPLGEELSASESREDEDGDNEPFLRTLPLSPPPSCCLDGFSNAALGDVRLLWSPWQFGELPLGRKLSLWWWWWLSTEISPKPRGGSQCIHGPFCSGWIQVVLGSIGLELVQLFHSEKKYNKNGRNAIRPAFLVCIQPGGYQGDNLLIFGVLHARRRLPSNQAAGKLHSLLKTANMAQPTARLGVCVKVMVFKDLDLWTHPHQSPVF